MGEHLNFIDDLECSGYPHPLLRPKRDRRQRFGTVDDRRRWPSNLMYAGTLVKRAIIQIGMVMVRPF